MPITLSGDTGITTPMYNGSITANAVTPSVNMKNRIINGAMVIFQRGTAATSDQTYSIDRWRFDKGNDATESVSQSTDAPVGFNYSLRNTISVGDASIGAAQFSGLQQAIEGFNIADLGWGTANAKTVTLSFWIRSSVTGQYTGNVRNSNDTRINPFNITISSANTWEYKTVTITGDTGGTWNSTNGIGMQVTIYAALGSNFIGGTANTWGASPNFGCGSPVNGIASNGNIFAITGVQLEVGSTATSFDYRPYGTELALCQRYFEKSYDTGTAVGTNTSTSAVYNYASTDQYSSLVASVPFKVEKRAAPTMTGYQTGGTSGSWAYGRSGATGTATVNFYDTGTSRFTQYMTIGASAYASAYCVGHWTASAEL